MLNLNNLFKSYSYKIIFNTNSIKHKNIIKINNIKNIKFLKENYINILNNNLMMFYTNNLNDFISFIEKYKNIEINLIIFEDNVYTINSKLILQNPILNLLNLLNFNLNKYLFNLNQIKISIKM